MFACIMLTTPTVYNNNNVHISTIVLSVVIIQSVTCNTLIEQSVLSILGFAILLLWIGESLV